MTEPIKRVTRYTNPGMFGSTARAHVNLNKLAEAFVAIGAIDTDRAIQFSTVAITAGVDKSNALKLLSDRPGFCRVIREQYGKRTLGFYYHAREFLPLAKLQGDFSYPINTGPLARRDFPLEEIYSDGLAVELGTASVALKPSVTTVSDSIRREPLVIEVIDFRGREQAIIRQANGIVTNLAEDLTGLLRSEWNGPLDLKRLNNTMVALASLYSALSENANNPEFPLIVGRALKETV